MNPPGFLARLLPARLRRREVLSANQRLELFARVPDNDPCLRAVLDLGQEMLESAFYEVIDPKKPELQRQRATDELRAIYFFLKHLEDSRAQAAQWRKEQEQSR